MCYHTTYLFLTCGHVELSSAPISCCSDPPARAHHEANRKNVGASYIDEPPNSKALPNPPSTPPPGSYCPQVLAHPLHTFTINTLCLSCQEERDARIQAFEAYMRDDLEQRIINRSAERNERGSEFGRRRLFRASTILAMMMDASGPVKRRSTMEEAWDTHSQAETLRSANRESVGKIVDDVRRRMGWSSGETVSSPTESLRGSAEHIVATPCSPSTPRLSFAAFGGATGMSDSR